MPAWKNLYHDDGIGWPELKFCHIDGREYIYGSPNKATPEYQLIKDDWRKGSYNYFPPIKNLAHENQKRFALYATNTILHLIFDLGPSYIPCIKKALNQRRRQIDCLYKIALKFQCEQPKVYTNKKTKLANTVCLNKELI